MNCCVVPLAIEGFAGVTAIEVKLAAVTVKPVEPLIDPEVALIVADPVATPVTTPALVMVATVVVLEDQVTVLVRSCVVLSL